MSTIAIGTTVPKYDSDAILRVSASGQNEFTKKALQRQANFDSDGSVDNYATCCVLAELDIGEDMLAYWLEKGSPSVDEEENRTLFDDPRWKQISLKVALLEADEETMFAIRRQAGRCINGDVDTYLSRAIAIWLIHDERQCAVDPISGIAYTRWDGEPPLSSRLPGSVLTAPNC